MKLTQHYKLTIPQFFLSKVFSFFFGGKVCLLFPFLAVPYGMWDLSFPIKDWTWAPALEVQSLNPWTTREVPKRVLQKKKNFFHRVLDFIKHASEKKKNF